MTAFFRKSRLLRIQNFSGPNLAVLWTGDLLIVNSKAPNLERHVHQSKHVFWAIRRVSLTKLLPVGWPRKRTKRKRAREESYKNRYNFTTMWRRHFVIDLHQIWWVCRSYRNHACPFWIQNIHWLFPAERLTKAFSHQKGNGLYNSATCDSAGSW